MGGDREKKVRIVCECEICRAWKELRKVKGELIKMEEGRSGEGGL